MIGVELDGLLRKIALIQFNQRDGSVFVQVPYFERSDGFVGVLEVDSSPREPLEYDFRVGAKTSHLVKLSYHPDGRAHFSQTNKVRQMVGRSATPLDDYRGPMFAIVAQGLREFRTGKARRGATLVNLGRASDEQRLTLTGYWHRTPELSEVSQGEVGPTVRFRIRDTWKAGEALAPRAGKRPHERCVIVSPEVAEKSGDGEPFVLMMGAFDVEPDASGPPKGAQCLVAAYPRSAMERLPDALDSIDLQT